MAQIQAAFIENWIEVTGQVLHSEDYFPERDRAGSQSAQFIVTSPGGGSESMQLMYLMSIAAVAKSISSRPPTSCPTASRSKVMLVDDLWVPVGSTNFDSRSFSVNDEANLNVYDRPFAVEQARIFEEDLKRSRRVSLEEWENRPWTAKLWENTLGLLSSQL